MEGVIVVKNNILIVVDNFIKGGLETNISGEVRELVKQGHSVYLACGRTYDEDFIPKGLDGFFPNLPLSIDTSINEVLMASDNILNIIQDNKIDIIHIHPFSILPSYLAAWRGGVKTVVTIHGPSNLMDFLSPVFRITILSIYNDVDVLTTVSPEILNLINAYGIDGIVMPNTIRINKEIEVKPKTSLSRLAKWLIVSRLSEDKINGVKDTIEKVSKRGLGTIAVVGDGDGRSGLENWCNSNGYEVDFLGARSDVEEITTKYDIIAGMGRAYLEGLARGKLGCLIGYDGVKGFMKDEKGFRKAAYCNFSGRNLPTINDSELSNQMRKLTVTPATIVSILQNEFSESKNWQNFVDTLSGPTNSRGSFAEVIYNLLERSSSKDEIWYIADNVVIGIIAHAIRNNSNNEYNQLLTEASKALEDTLINMQSVIAEEGVFVTEPVVLSKRYILADKIADRLNRLIPSGTARRKITSKLIHSLVKMGGVVSVTTKRISRKGNTSFAVDETMAKEAETIKASGLFDREWYLAQNPDVAHYKIDPLSHFITHGVFEGRDPSKKFSIFLYKAHHPELVIWQENLLLHYLENKKNDNTRYTRSNLNRYRKGVDRSIIISISKTKHLIVFESMDWFKSMSQRPHHLARLFADKGITVVYIDESQPLPVKINDNLYIVNRGYDINFIIDDDVKKYHWVFSTASYSSDYIDKLRFMGYEIIYDYIDDFDESISIDVDKQKALYKYMRKIQPKVLIASADRLVKQLKVDMGRNDIVVAKNAVDLTHFNIRMKYTNNDVPEDLRPILRRNRPIVGYYGAIAPWLDYELINSITEKEFDKEFVFIGVDYRDALKYLQLRDNVHFLGPKDYELLASYSYWFDCALIPFSRGDIAKSTSPVKLFEYMAMGIPTVCTADMKECYGYDYVYIAKDEKQYSKYINEAIAARKTVKVRRSLERSAKKNTWQARVNEVHRRLV